MLIREQQVQYGRLLDIEDEQCQYYCSFQVFITLVVMQDQPCDNHLMWEVDDTCCVCLCLRFISKMVAVLEQVLRPPLLKSS